MKKLVLIVLSLCFINIYAQSKYTLEEVEKSEDPKVLSDFIVNNYNHPSVPKLKQKLIQLITKNIPKSPVSDTIQPIIRGKQKELLKQEESKSKNNSSQNNTTDILNYLLKDNAHKGNTAYIAIRNLSQCPISVIFTGEKTYTLEISPQSLGRILIDKGNYNISSKVCNAKYNANREITNDFEMSLNSITTIKKQ